MSTATRSPTTSASSIPQIFGFSCELSILSASQTLTRYFNGCDPFVLRICAMGADQPHRILI